MNNLKKIAFQFFGNEKKSLDPKIYNLGKKYNNSEYFKNGIEISKLEKAKPTYRFNVINFCLDYLNRKTTYLEIGVRFPDDNFNKINATTKFSVDPGLENEENPVDFKLTSDDFFDKLKNEEVLSKDLKFDVIFIDGLHLADQVERDIENALTFIKDDGYIILHDCNPPSEYHAREDYKFDLSPARGFWNGTTWKAFFRTRQRKDVFSCCVDSDWGIGVVSKQEHIGKGTEIKNPFYEFRILEENRINSLGLVSFEEFKMKFSAKSV